MTDLKLPQADMLADDIFGNPTEWYNKDTVTSILASQRADWLRSEIEKLESGIVGEVLMDMEGTTNRAFDEGHNQALTSIITRYKEELLELEKGI